MSAADFGLFAKSAQSKDPGNYYAPAAKKVLVPGRALCIRVAQISQVQKTPLWTRYAPPLPGFTSVDLPAVLT